MPSPMRRRFGATAAVVVAALAVLSACAGTPDAVEPTPRPVTTEEAQLLAITRFNNFDLGSRPFSTSVTETGAELALQGWVDYASHLGYATVDDGAAAPHALLWNDATVGVIPAEPDAMGDPPLPIPDLADPAWISHPLDATASRLDALLVLIGSLASDRPDNPLLVQQTGALWLREDEVDGVEVTVFAAPPSDEPPDASSPPITADTSPLRLWVDASGVLRRAEVRIGSDWSTVDFGEDSGPTLSLPEGSG